MQKCLFDNIFVTISDVIADTGTEAYVIGGFVRDCILKRKQEDMDIDIVVTGSGIEIAKKVAKKISPKIKVSYFKNFGTAMFKAGTYEIEFVGARKESYNRDSRKPIVENGTIEDDQKRRDFTINALAISLNKNSYGDLIDPFNGINDIKSKIIRTPLDPDQTFSDDPLRMLRAIRFASQLEFSIEEGTFNSIKKNAGRISIVSSERISTEINKILLSDKPSVGFHALQEAGLLTIFFPELQKLKGIEVINKQAHKDNFDHTMEVLDNVSRESDSLWLRWAAILHDIAKPVTKKFIEGSGWTFHGHEFIGAKMIPGIFRRLKLPMNEKMKYIQKLIALHLRPIILSQEKVTDSAIRRLLFEADDDIDDLMLLCEADITSKNERIVKKHLKNFILVRKKLIEIEERDSIRNFQPPISGTEIIDMFELEPGKEIGILKNSIKDAILDGIIPNDYDAARKFLIEKAKSLGIKKT